MSKKELSKQEKIKIFEDNVKYYQEYFNLMNWDIECCEALNLSEASDTTNAIARTEMEYGNYAKIFYCGEWIEKTNDTYQIRVTAFHEVLEVLLMKLRIMSIERDFYYSEREIDNEVHSIIHTMENKIFPLLDKK